jgi:hypothetical protein
VCVCVYITNGLIYNKTAYLLLHNIIHTHTHTSPPPPITDTHTISRHTTNSAQSSLSKGANSEPLFVQILESQRLGVCTIESHFVENFSGLLFVPWWTDTMRPSERVS